MKECNVKRHYDMKIHCCTGQELKQLAAILSAQQNQFFHANQVQENVTRASYEVTQFISQYGKPFPEIDFVQEYHAKVN